MTTEAQRLRDGLKKIGSRVDQLEQGRQMAAGTPDNGRLLARIDERVKALDDKLTMYHDDMCKRLDDHEGRIRVVEANMRDQETSNRRGVIADIGAAAVAVAAAVKAFVAP